MKGVLLSGGRGRSLFKRQDVTYFLHRYGISTILGFSFLLGLIFGALCAGGADKSLIVKRTNGQISFDHALEMQRQIPVDEWQE